MNLVYGRKKKKNTWNPHNTRQLLDYAQQMDYEMDIELGNGNDSIYVIDYWICL